MLKIGLKLSRRYCYLPKVIDPNPTQLDLKRSYQSNS